MSAKRKDKVPSWIEVGLGAVLSVALGVVLGAAYLVFKPVLKVKEIPKDAPSGAIYYIEGSRDFTKSSEADATRKSFASGESVTIDEGGLNMLLGNFGKADTPAPKAGDKAPAAAAKALDVGALNARIKEGKIQFADTVTFNVLSVTGAVIVQARGVFEKSGSGFAFEPESFSVGGCPLERFPVVRSWIMKRLLFPNPPPPDVAAAWSKLTAVTIEGTSLKLRMP
ncbi:MAG TPA: hypothetical protein VII43_08445 [Opitutaceae bacterium]